MEASFSIPMLRRSLEPSVFGQKISVVIPVYNEAQIITEHLTLLCHYLSKLTISDRYRWEIIIVDDGSSDGSAIIARNFAAKHKNIYVVCHEKNYGLGKALCSGFAFSKGDWIICLDIDLTYSLDHIRTLLRAKEGAQVVMTSPYMPGGEVSCVPWLRKWLSLLGNSILSYVNVGNISTFTSMVRLYDADLIKCINLNSSGAEINLEILYKAIGVGAKVVEIPSHLNWQSRERTAKFSPGRLLRQVGYVIQYAFLFFKQRHTVKLWSAYSHG